MSVTSGASRKPCRPTLPAALITLSTSLGVRCSRVRRFALATRFGGGLSHFQLLGTGALAALRYSYESSLLSHERTNMGK